MKQLIGLIALLFIVGVGGFLYRNTMEHPVATAPDQTQACTEEAKICPDGTSVGRTGPNCSFAVCSVPNKEMPELRISYVAPAGYTENAQAPNGDLKIAYEKQSKSANTPHAIIIRDFLIQKGKTANEVMLAQTMFESSGNQPKSMTEFKPIIIQGKTFQSIVVERFEGQVHSLYYLPRTQDVLRFEVLERDVDWTNPKLIVENLPEHKALLTMLSTLSSGE